MAEELAPADLAAVEAELGGIQAQMGDRGSVYWKDGGQTQRRYLALLDSKLNGGPVPAKSSDAEAEMVAIRQAMGDGSYWRKPEMAQRYQELLRLQEGASPAPADAAVLMPVMTLREWQQAGGDPTGHELYRKLVARANDVVVAVAEEEREDFAHTFHGLPAAVQEGAFAALADPRPVAAEAVSGGELAALRKEFPDLAQAWGTDAGTKLGLARARVWRALGAMGEAEAKVTLRWMERLAPAALGAVLRALAR